MTTQEQTYQYIIEHCGCQYIYQQKKYSAFITLRYDHQEYGVTVEAAKHNLAYKLSKMQHIRNQLAEILNK